MPTQAELQSLWNSIPAAAPTQPIQQQAQQPIQQNVNQSDLQSLWDSLPSQQSTHQAQQPIQQPQQNVQVPEAIQQMRQGTGFATKALNALGPFGEGLRRAGEGFAQTALQAGEALGLNVPSSQEFTRNVEDRRSVAEQPQGFGAKAAQFAGEVAPSLFIPPVIKGGALAAGLTNAAINAGLSATQFTPEGGSKANQAIAGAALGGALEFGVRGVAGAITTKQSTKDMIAAFEEAGTTPTVGQATGNKFLQGIENALGKIIGGQGISARAAAKAQQELGQASENMANHFAKRYTDEMAGGVVRKGIKQFADDFKARSETLFRRLNDFVPAQQPVSVSNTLKTFKEITATTPGARKTSDLLISNNLKELAKAFKEDATNGTIPFEALQEIRSSIGRKLSSFELVSDLPKGELKRLYGAITEDMKNVAESVDGGLQSFNRANNFYRSGMKRIDDFLQPIAKKTEDIDIYNALVTSGKKGVQKLSAIKRSIKPDQWETFVGAQMKELGMTSPGAQGAAGNTFSSDVFLTNWNKINPQARKVLFSGTPELSAYGDKMAKLAQVSERIKDAASTLKNPSGTAGLAASIAQILGVGASAVGSLATLNPAYIVLAASGIGAAAGGEKLLTNPKVVNFISRLPSTTPFSKVAGYLGRGGAFYSHQDDETRRELDAYTQQGYELESLLNNR